MVRAAATAVSVIVLAACTSAAGRPATPRPSSTGPAVGAAVRVTAVPIAAPRATVEGHSCFVPGTNTAGNVPDHGVVTIDPDPVGAVAEWLPGLDRRPCRAQLTHIGQPSARGLAAAANTGQVIEVGAAYSCPADDGSAVVLFFQFPGRVVETVSVNLTGCGFITTPARVSRFTSTAMQTALDTLAPPPWP